MTRHRGSSLRLLKRRLAEKHKQYGFLSLDTLAAWNPIYLKEDVKFSCKKQSEIRVIRGA
jgi:hypothetical protein